MMEKRHRQAVVKQLPVARLHYDAMLEPGRCGIAVATVGTTFKQSFNDFLNKAVS